MGCAFTGASSWTMRRSRFEMRQTCWFKASLSMAETITKEDAAMADAPTTHSSAPAA